MAEANDQSFLTLRGSVGPLVDSIVVLLDPIGFGLAEDRPNI